VIPIQHSTPESLRCEYYHALLKIGSLLDARANAGTRPVIALTEVREILDDMIDSDMIDTIIVPLPKEDDNA